MCAMGKQCMCHTQCVEFQLLAPSVGRCAFVSATGALRGWQNGELERTCCWSLGGDDSLAGRHGPESRILRRAMRISVQHLLGLISAASLGGVTASCSNVLGIEDTTLGEAISPQQDAGPDGEAGVDAEGGVEDGPAEAEAAPPQPGHDWSCVGKTTTAPVDGGIQITAVVDSLFAGRFDGITVRACANRLDRLCSNPIDTRTTADGGIAVLTIPENRLPYVGYLRLDGEADAGIVPYYSYFSRPLVESREFPFLSVTWDELSEYIIADGEHVPGRGHLFINVTDCKDQNAPGVVFNVKTAGVVDDQTIPFYGDENGFTSVPSKTTSAPEPWGGRGGWFNLKVDEAVRVEFESVPDDLDGTPSAMDSWWVEPDALTTGRLLPK